MSGCSEGPQTAQNSAGGDTSTTSAGVASSAANNAAGGASQSSAATSGGLGNCSFKVTSSVSEAIASVGIVEFSVDLPDLDSASIDFGLDDRYGMRAPVDLAEPNHRTLLVGMKTSREYHFRITVSAGDEQCQSGDYSLMTGARPNDLDTPEITTPLPDQLSGGFLVTARWGTNNGGPAFILDADNDLVWWYSALVDVIRARMSYNGKSMWIRNTAQLDGTGVVQRVRMDGLEEARWELPQTTHDLAVLPDGKVGLIAHTAGGCDEIIELDPTTGNTKSIFNVQAAHGNSECHVNYLAYSAIDDSYYISDWAASSYIKISRTGELAWVLNGDASTLSGSNWENQHGIHVLAADHVLIFSNGAGAQNSLALEFRLDQSSSSATELWRYDANLQAPFGGDIQRLENGNTLVTYSSLGVIHEVNSQAQLVQELAFPLGDTVSYAVKRDSLYGSPPPKIHAFEAR